VPFYRSGLFSLTLLGRLLVEFTSPKLGEDARFFTGTLEATQCMARPPAFGDRGAHSKGRSPKRQRLRAGIGVEAAPKCDFVGFYGI
jgi:hypothetical protein